MSAIGPGTMLCCVDDHGSDLVTVGRTYECTVVGPGKCTACGEGTGVQIAEVPLPPWEGFCARQFVPAGRRGMFDHLLKTEPVKETQDA